MISFITSMNISKTLENEKDMKNSTRRIIYGLAIWLVPFIVASMLWDPTTNLPRVNMMWYGAIMNAAWAIVFLIGALYYFKSIKENYKREGIIAGITWYLLAVIPEFAIVVGLFHATPNDSYPSILAYFTTLFMPMLIGSILNANMKRKTE